MHATDCSRNATGTRRMARFHWLLGIASVASLSTAVMAKSMVGIAIAKSNARVYAWFNDGTVTQGVSSVQGQGALLGLGNRVQRQLQGGESHRYRVRLAVGQFLHLVVQQKGIDIIASLDDPGGETVAEMDSANGLFGPEPLSVIAAVSGEYLLRVHCDDKNAAAGEYEVRVTDLRLPKPEDHKRIAAECLSMEATRLAFDGAQSIRKAITNWEQALPLWQAVGDRYEQALTLNGMGFSYSDLGEKQKALEYFNQALSLRRAVGDRTGEAETLTNIGLVYSGLGEKQKALDYYNQALPLRRAAGDRAGEAKTLTDIGLVYSSLGEKQKALDYYNQALPLRRAVGDRAGEAATLHDIGAVYSALGEKQKALEYFNQALPLERAAGDRAGEATTLNSIGLVYSGLGEKQKALEYYNQALPLERAAGDRVGEATTLNNIGAFYDSLGEMRKALEYYNQALPLERAEGDRALESTTLGNIGSIYAALGEKQKALEYYNQDLALARAVGNRSGEATTLTNMGAVYSALGEKQKALEYYNQALPLRRAVGNRAGEATTLSDMGVIYAERGEKQKALEYYNQALPLHRAVGNRAGEATTLSNMGVTYSELGEKQKALEYYNQALPLSRAVGDRAAEVAILSNLAACWKEQGKISLAIFFGKQAINTIQQIRRNLEGMEQETQRTFLKTEEAHYRELADWLVSQGRLFEAQQVLGLLKEEEFKEFTHGDDTSGAAGKLALTSRERAMEKRYNEGAGSVSGIGTEWKALRDKKQRTAEEERHFQQLSRQLADAEKSFQRFIEQELYEQLGNTQQADASVRELEQTTSDLQAVLREVEAGTVALYTVPAPKRLIIILVTPDVRVAREYPITAEALREKTLRLWRALSAPGPDALPAAQELYKIVLGPVEKDLEAAHARTLMWSLDDVLRYIPMAALHDGKQFVLEKYRTEVFTLSSISKLKDTPRPKPWQILATGISKSYGGSSPLPAVPGELQSIVRTSLDAKQGLLPGLKLLDDDFTEDNFTKALAQKFSVVHVASHFRFEPGADDVSYLLLGGKSAAGEHLTLAQIKTDPNIRFSNTELLTLSACETAMSGEHNGREIDGLAEVVQRKGAKAVVASLWSVNDSSTGALMHKFYQTWIKNPGMPKAEALRQAQLALLRGEVKRDATASARGLRPIPSNVNSALEENFAHPYYWAPFILIGNWK